MPRADEPVKTARPAGALIARQLVDPKDRDDTNTKKEPSVTITAIGDKLIVTSDDPETLRQVNRLVRLLTEVSSEAVDFHVVRLKNASAPDAAKVIDEVFNGPRQPVNPQPAQLPGRGGRFLGQPAAPPAAPRVERVRVVADPETNALLIRASPLDLVAIRQLIDTAIDVGPPSDAKGIMRTHVIGPLRYAVATEVADVLRGAYREDVNNNPLGGAAGGGRFRTPVPNQNIGPDGQPRAVTLSVAVDDQTNSLIVQCNDNMFEDIHQLVDQLEKAARDSTHTVQVMRTRGVDPTLVQGALDALQGRTTGRGNGSGSTMSGGGFSPFRSNGGGFRPSGGNPFGGTTRPGGR
jgi:hypothetical protein